MKDREFWRLTLDTNPEDCNYSCIMCEEHSSFSQFKQDLFAKNGIKRREMPQEWLARLFEEAKSLGVREVIPSTMGEPLVYKYFDDIVELCQTHEIKLNLTTNGSFPKRSAKDWAKMLVPITSDVKFSWNGARKETMEAIMKGCDFDKSLADLKTFISVRDKHFKDTGYYCSITFQLTFLSTNSNELLDIIKLAASLGVDRVKGHHLWTHFEEIKELSMKASTGNIRQWNTISEQAALLVKSNLKPNGEEIKLENFQRIDERKASAVPQESNCPFLGKELWVSAVGKISPCCAPDEQRNSLGDFGTYPHTTISEVIKSDQYNTLISNYKQYPLCAGCVMRK